MCSLKKHCNLCNYIGLAVADVGFLKGGFITFLARRPPKIFARPRPLPVKNPPFSGKFADSAMFIQLVVLNNDSVLHVASHLVYSRQRNN